MPFFYDVGLKLYKTAISIWSLKDEKAKKWKNGRKEQSKNLEENLLKNSGAYWFHCASLGEFEQAKPLIDEIKSLSAQNKVVVTFFSPSGYEIRKHFKNADYICYLPLDSKNNAKQFVGWLKPKAAFFVKYELWYHYLNELKGKQVKSYLVSAVFREDHRYFKWYGKLFKQMLLSLDFVFVQDKKSEEILKLNECQNVLFTGDTRFDRVNESALNAKKDEVIEAFIKDSKLVIAGSSWQPEEEMLSKMKEENKVKLIIAPHDVSKKHIDELKLKFPAALLYTKWEESNEESFVMIVDCIGVLSNIYQYGQIAFIGGGFTGALHNILEPATFGCGVVFGPKHDRFPEAQALIDAEGALEITQKEDLRKLVSKLYDGTIEVKQLGRNARIFVEQNLGATKRIIKKLKEDKVL